ncbi:hypothetical protein OPV22_010671 [Ensete ventricosum]|uniref:SMP-30/Gluconolactonase/LRE-like region domain-containing protein n=1 Tax=Ensete ventricosum TaxID=4639 RepID=A0AAV8RDL4_ENSVE|nr:hypothetical protein OPV22_010671 [Ensete ventricosum]
MEEAKKKAMVLLCLVVLSGGFCCVSAASPARLVSAFVSNLLSALLRRLWSLTPSTRNAILNRSSVKFESGYNVETVFDGSKLGIEPFSVGVMPCGDLLVVDSMNSNIYKVSLPLSKYSRPKLVAGSAEGYTGHVDGKPRAARMNHPKGLAVDDKGNIYVADTKNKAIRKVSDTGVTTIAGGKLNKGGHVDGPSEDATFSSDFEVVYIGSSCSLLVVDRGNQAIREIQLHFDDCAYQYGTGFPLGIAMLFAAGFFGYMLAMLQQRWAVVVSSTNDPTSPTEASYLSSPYQQPLKSSLRPPLIPPEPEYEKHEEEEGLFTSVKKLVTGPAEATTQGKLMAPARKFHCSRRRTTSIREPISMDGMENHNCNSGTCRNIGSSLQAHGPTMSQPMRLQTRWFLGQCRNQIVSTTCLHPMINMVLGTESITRGTTMTTRY